jgi:hypothetical protein
MDLSLCGNIEGSGKEDLVAGSVAWGGNEGRFIIFI